MTSSLRDIPGLGPDGRRGRGRGRGRRRGLSRFGGGGGSLSFGPRALRIDTADRRGGRRFGGRFRGVEWGALFAWVLGLGTLAVVAVLAYRGTRVDVTQTGLEDGDALNALELAATEVTITFESVEEAEGSELSFDGEVVEEPALEGVTMRWRPPQDLEEGEHTLSLKVPRVLLKPARLNWDFVVDRTAPTVEAAPVAEAVGLDDAATVTGKVEPGSDISVAGGEVDVRDDGTFEIAFERPPAGPITLQVVDRAGNTATASVVVPVKYPSLRGVYVSAAGWSDPRLRDGVLALLDQRRIDTVVLDLKDESGVVGFDTKVDRARQIGAVTPYVALDDVVATVDRHGGRVVGRIVTFRDPKLAAAAWGGGQPDQVVQRPGGAPYGNAPQFTNPVHPEVQRYNLDIALDAVERGVHDILWDEVRRPTGDPAEVIMPNMTGSHSQALLGFLATAHGELRRRDVYQGVGVSGLSADDRGADVSQDVAQMARRADYVVPTIHPAYWTPGEFGVPSPVHQPGDLVNRVLTAFTQKMATSGAPLAPSLQDFSARGVGYGPGEVRAQIDNATLAGVTRFILWDTSATYTAEALDPQPP